MENDEKVFWFPRGARTPRTCELGGIEKARLSRIEGNEHAEVANIASVTLKVAVGWLGIRNHRKQTWTALSEEIESIVTHVRQQRVAEVFLGIVDNIQRYSVSPSSFPR